MILRSIELNNIRSYKNSQTVNLKPGVLLFEGDIGSGKSTILSGIEFALFGLGDVDGHSLLRLGENTGTVSLEFEENGNNFKIFRNLQRQKNSVTQDEGYIIEDGERTDYSVTEMKQRVLEILSFNERPQPKTTSLIYRYAIFTPQEMMKEVLYQGLERRLDTLRRAFRIQDYSNAANNADLISNWFEQEIRALAKQTGDIHHYQQQLESETDKLLTLRAVDLKNLEHNLGKINNELDTAQHTLENLQSSKEKILKLQVHIPDLNRNFEATKKTLVEDEENHRELENQVEEIHKAESILSAMAKNYENYEAAQKITDDLETNVARYDKLSVEHAKLKTDIANKKGQLKREIETLDSDTENLQNRVKKEQRQTSRLQTLTEQNEKWLKEIKALPTITKRLMEQRNQKSKLTQKITDSKENLAKMKVEYDKIKRIGIGAPCPKCRQPLSKKHFEKLHTDYRKKITELKAELIDTERRRTKLLANTRLDEKIETKINQTKEKLTELKTKIATLKEFVKALNERQDKLAKTQSKLTKLQKEIKAFPIRQRAKLEAISKELKLLYQNKEKYDSARQVVRRFEKQGLVQKYHRNKEKLERKESISTSLQKSRGHLQELRKNLENIERELTSEKTEFEQEKEVLTQVETIEDQRRRLDEKKSEAREGLAAKKKEIEHSQERCDSLKDDLEKLHAQLFRKIEFDNYSIWLDDHFSPAVSDIERHVLSSINDEFNNLFQRWFTYLIEEGDLRVKVDENFAPVIEQHEYEIAIDSLSGGERTSVALAYRLALNVMVKKIGEAMHSNLIILDEPTDGFSREQLFRVRDLLNELNCEQIIMVSHEKELEGFVDKIYRVEKEAGVSVVSEVA